MWPSVFHWCMVGTLLYQLCLLGVLAAYKFPAAISILAPIAWTIATWVYCIRVFNAPSVHGALDEMQAPDPDLNLVGNYVQPEMRLPDELPQPQPEPTQSNGKDDSSSDKEDEDDATVAV